MAVALFPFRNPNPLGFPGGMLPGYDPTHVAAGGVQFSGVAFGGSFVNILKGKAASLVSTPAGTLTGTIGPGLNCASSSTAAANFSGNSTANPTSSTIAAIILRDGTTTRSNTIFANNTASCGVALFVLSGTDALEWGMFGVANTILVNPIPSGSVPLFIIASQLGGTGVNFLVMRLDTGKITNSGQAAQASTPASGENGTFTVGNGTNAAQGFLGSAAAVMYSNQYMSLQAMFQWAADPWSFWYPATKFNRVGATAATVVVPWPLLRGRRVI